MTREELIEQMARAICLIDPRDDDPDAEVAGHMDDSGPRFPAWTFYRDQAEAALLSLEQSGFMIVEGWMTVESAPKDETHILGYNGEDMFVMDWLGTEWQLTHSGTYADDGDIWPDPTHYMPLPSPPKSTDDSEEAEARTG